VAVTAAVDVLVDRDKMARLLGRSDAKTVAQSLFKKGASPQSMFAFALAATNIVFELGILISILLGWSYLGGELLSGVVLIVLVWLIARFTLPKAVFELSRRRLQEADGDAGAPTPTIGRHAVSRVPARSAGSTTGRPTSSAHGLAAPAFNARSKAGAAFGRS